MKFLISVLFYVELGAEIRIPFWVKKVFTYKLSNFAVKKILTTNPAIYWKLEYARYL